MNELVSKRYVTFLYFFIIANCGHDEITRTVFFWGALAYCAFCLGYEIWKDRKDKRKVK
jgi:pyruvate-formate lyase-activating enzyme